MTRRTQLEPPRATLASGKRTQHIRFQFYHFSGGARPHLGATDTTWSPPVDCYETRESVVVELNLAGIHSHEVSIHFSWKAVQVSGYRSEGGGDETRCYSIMEIERGKFVRTIELPAPFDSKQAQATFENGMLTLTLPRISGSPLAGCSTAGNIKDFDDTDEW